MLHPLTLPLCIADRRQSVEREDKWWWQFLVRFRNHFFGLNAVCLYLKSRHHCLTFPSLITLGPYSRCNFQRISAADNPSAYKILITVSGSNDVRIHCFLVGKWVQNQKNVTVSVRCRTAPRQFLKCHQTTLTFWIWLLVMMKLYPKGWEILTTYWIEYTVSSTMFNIHSWFDLL